MSTVCYNAYWRTSRKMWVSLILSNIFGLCFGMRAGEHRIREKATSHSGVGTVLSQQSGPKGKLQPCTFLQGYQKDKLFFSCFNCNISYFLLWRFQKCQALSHQFSVESDDSEPEKILSLICSVGPFNQGAVIRLSPILALVLPQSGVCPIFGLITVIHWAHTARFTCQPVVSSVGFVGNI